MNTTLGCVKIIRGEVEQGYRLARVQKSQAEATTKALGIREIKF